MTDNLALPAGSISILQCDIISHTGVRIDFRGLVREFSLFDNIQKPFVTASFLIGDAVSLLTVLPIIGQETIEIEFKTPHKAFEQSVKMKLRVIGVENFNRSNARTAEYLLVCVSPEYVANTAKSVKKSWGDVSISEMVQKIFDDFLKDEDELKIVDATEGTRTIVIPNMRPSVAIKFLCGEAKSTDYIASNYLFWQSFEEFKFQTIESLIATKPDRKDRYFTTDFNTFDDSISAADVTLADAGAAGISRDAAAAQAVGRSNKPFEFMKIYDFTFVHLTQYDKVARLGGLESELHTIDPTTKVHEVKNYNYFMDHDKFKRTVSYSSQKDAYGQVTAPGDTTHNYFLPENTDLMAPEAIAVNYLLLNNKYQQNGYNPDQKEEFVLLERASFAMLENLVVNVTVPGDSTRRAGDLINLEFPEYGGTEDVKGKLNKFISGEYLVIGTRHIYTGDGYKTSMLCAKNTFDTNFLEIEDIKNGL